MTCGENLFTRGHGTRLKVGVGGGFGMDHGSLRGMVRGFLTDVTSSPTYYTLRVKGTGFFFNPLTSRGSPLTSKIVWR